MLDLQARTPNLFTLQQRLSAGFSTCFSFERLSSLLSNLNNLVRGIPFSYDDKIQEHIKESLLLGRRTKEKFCLVFALAFAGFRKGLSAENLLLRREEMTD